MGTIENPVWEMSFYTTERSRKTGIAYFFKLLGAQCPMCKFELKLAEIVKRGVVIPFIPNDRAGKLERVVEIDWKSRNPRPKWKDN